VLPAAILDISRGHAGARHPEPEVLPKLLSWTMDQGPDGLAATWYALYQLPLLACPFFGPSHRCANNLLNAIADAGLREKLLLAKIIFSAPWGPWNSVAWYSQLREAAREYHRIAGPGDPLFLAMLPEVAHERGQRHRLLEPGYAARAWEAMLAEQEQLGPRFQLSRWGSAVDVLLRSP